MTALTEHEPHGVHQTRKAAASGWIGSALEYYDFFIYASAAALVFPQIFFPSGNPRIAIIASLATYGVGYVARPVGAFFLGHWGDTHGRKTVLLVCMFLMGILHHGRRRAADLPAGRHPRSGPAGAAAPHPGICGCRRNLGSELDDPRACAVRPPRLFCQLLAARRAGGADPGSSGVSAARVLPAGGAVQRLGMARSLPAQCRRHHRGLHHPPRGRRDTGVRRGGRARRRAEKARSSRPSGITGRTCCGSSAWR